MVKEIRGKILLALSGIVGVIFLMTEVWAKSYVVVSPAKVFERPRIDSPAISFLTPGTEVEVLEKSPTGRWVRIRAYNGKIEGWVALSKLKPKKKTEDVNLSNSTEARTTGVRDETLGVNLDLGVIPNVGEIGRRDIKKEDKVEISNVVYVKPNRVTMVEMSSLDINRVYCDGEITDVIFSEEKGVKVKIVRNNAFVKFLVKKIGEEEIPIEKPVDLFFVCDNQVFSVIAIPKRIPPAFIYLETKERKIREAIEKVRDLPYEKRLLEVIKAIYLGRYEPNFQVVNVNKEFHLFRDIKVVLEKVIDIEGEGLRAKVFRLETSFPSNLQYVEIKEKDFVRKELTSIPLAISLDKAKLQGKDKATLIIVEKRVGGE
jgi:conjugal transfer pilus assembly protein TraK